MPSRTRYTFKDVHLVGNDFESYVDYPEAGQIPVPFDVGMLTFQSNISDENHGRKHGRVWGDLVHAKYTLQNTGRLTSVLTNRGTVKSFSGSAGPFGSFGTGSSYDGVQLGVYPFESAVFDKVADRADALVQDITTQIQESFGLAVDVIEAKDILNIIPEFKHILQLLGDLLLSYQFGIKPTIDDLRKLFGSAFQETHARIEFLRKFNGKTITVRRSGALDIGPESGYEISLTCSRGDLVYTAVPYSCDVTFGLVAKAQLNLTGLDDWNNVFDAYAAAFGLLNPIKTWWDHVPYSFVVEWFVNLNSFINGLGGKPFGGSIDIVDSWATSRVGVLYELYQERDLRSNPVLPRENTGTTILCQEYRRTKGLPMKGLFSADLSVMQELLLGAMLRQRIPHL